MNASLSGGHVERGVSVSSGKNKLSGRHRIYRVYGLSNSVDLSAKLSALICRASWERSRSQGSSTDGKDCGCTRPGADSIG